MEMICNDCHKYAWCGYRNKFPNALITECKEYVKAKDMFDGVWCRNCNHHECWVHDKPQTKPIKCAKYEGAIQLQLF